MSPVGSNRGRRPRRVGESLSFAFVAIGVWLGWQVVREPVVARVPVGQAIRLSPDSAAVLGRAAEAEFAADRFSNARDLARQSLSRRPFNVQALRVLGLATAEIGGKPRADDMLTLAGNWSLRDDPAHAWLLEYRLSQGDYGSAFAHADTLARRRHDLQPQLFRLFTTAASEDPRAIPFLASLLAVGPPWRPAYLGGLYHSDEGLALSANLAVALQPTALPFHNRELSALYDHLLARHRLPAVIAVRDRLERPALDQRLINGDFDPPKEPTPFDWKLFRAGGLVAEILLDDIRGDSALRAQFSSFSSRPLAEQLVLLPPGNYRLSGQTRREVGDSGERLSWTVSCIESSDKLGSSEIVTPPGDTGWRDFAVNFTVPSQGCAGQWLRLVPKPAGRRDTAVAWYDHFSIVEIR